MNSVRVGRCAYPVVVSMGDPNGIGPEVTLKALADFDATGMEAVVFGDPDYLSQLGENLGLPKPRSVEFRHSASTPYPPAWGQPSPDAGRFSIAALNSATAFCKEEGLPLLVTAPINKLAATSGGFTYPGQTEFVAAQFPRHTGAMAFFSERLNVILATVHIPLREVFSALSVELLVQRTMLLGDALVRLGIQQPRVAVCGLNPHASENGLFGEEEAAIIEPAIEILHEQAIFSVVGPISPDTAFYRAAVRNEFDGVVALFHDQALIPLKLIAFDSAVNVTLGLPIVRTSPDHGTAFDIAGKGLASCQSMRAAIEVGVRIADSRGQK